jgi:hypothetical protein
VSPGNFPGFLSLLVENPFLPKCLNMMKRVKSVVDTINELDKIFENMPPAYQDSTICHMCGKYVM